MKIKRVLLRITFMILSLLTILFLSAQIYAVVFEPKPCAIVSCTQENFGKWITEAELIGYENGYAICHCPHEPSWVTYKVSQYRKY